MQKQNGDWKRYREQFALTSADGVDLHFGRRNPHVPYREVMNDVVALVEERLREAQRKGRPYVLFVHGWSTSRPGQTTARSMVRRFMRSTEATPLIVRSGCIQHDTAFVAKVRPLQATG
jgi:microcystin degradation protein MlrC